jgi:lipopolysaccharide/colanic/teichoic acid biosynthesis glycosyltransferase
MWKFRTMVVDAERRGPPLTVGADPRITPLGSWLRRHKLDELPQLVNVLRGDMTLVGPRPEVRRYVARYTPQQRRVLDLVPGMTDPASVRFRDESLLLAAAADPEVLYVHRLMPEKIRLNLDYAARATVWSDLVVILTTAASLLSSARTPAAGRAPTTPRRWDDSHVRVEQ